MASPPVLSRAETILRTGRPATRRGNWWALGVGSVLIGSSFVAFGGAMSFDTPDAGMALVAVAMGVLAFGVIAGISGREAGVKRIAQATALLIVVTLVLGLPLRILGMAVGLPAGVIMTLNPPPFENVFRNRVVGAALALMYAFLLLYVIPPAGVLTAALVPPLAVGLADEYSAWRSQRSV